MKDYDYTIEYHLGKENTVTDALSRKTRSNVSSLQISSLLSLIELRAMNVDLNIETIRALFCILKIQPILKEGIQEEQPLDLKFVDIIEKVKHG